MTHDAKLDPADDPRLTAYALGELPESERAAVEAILASDADARRFVEETREFAKSLGDEFAAAPAGPALTDAQRVLVRDHAVARPAGRVLRVSNWSVPAGLAAAALVAVTFSFRREIGAWWSPARDVARGRPGEVVSPGWGPSSNAWFGADGARDEALNAPMRAPEREAQRLASERAAAAASAEAYLRERAAKSGEGRAGVYRGPGGEVPPDSRAPSEPPPPKDGLLGPGTPGGRGPTTGGGAAGKNEALGRRHREAGGGGGDGGGLVLRQTDGSVLVERNEAGKSAEEWKVLLERRLTDGREAGVFFARTEDPNGAVVWRDALPSDARVAEVVRRLRVQVEVEQLPPEQAAARLLAETRSLAERMGKDSPENYAALADNPFRKVLDSALSTFGIDVDTASYANVRRFLTSGQLPPPGAVRIEEMVNYFPYQYAPPTGADPFALHVEVAGCPWDTSHRLVRVGLKGREVDLRERPQSNLVFLIDVSGSMQPANKLPLLVASMKELVAQLDARDKVSVVVYAGAAGTVLPPTAGDQRETILGALDRLRAGGSTAGGAGIELAYRTALENFVPGGINRVILATDGDFNVGVSDESSLVRLIEEKAKSKVFLSVLGFGTGNLQDAKMEALADKGNGNYAYVDSLKEGRKVLVEQAAGTLLTIAKDVKLQIEFNPVRVAEYRLLGYENRVLATEDFANDRKDAGDLGAGHTVTALYEIVPTTVTAATASEPLRYQQGGAPTAAAHSGELMTVKLRFKEPEGDTSVLREFPVQDAARGFDAASPDFQFAASVAAAGMLLRGSPHKGSATFDMALELAQGALAFDPGGHRAEFVDLLRRAKTLSAR